MRRLFFAVKTRLMHLVRGSGKAYRPLL